MHEGKRKSPSIPLARELDPASLKGLAHPLRVAMLDYLTVHGPATASQIAEILRESSAQTSYHLRQLDRHGFVREVDGLGSSRERWWERIPGAGWRWSPEGEHSSASGQAAAQIVLSEFEQQRRRHIDDFRRYGSEKLPREWTDAAQLTTTNVRLTAEQFAQVSAALANARSEILKPYLRKSPDGSRPVQVHLNIFPVLEEEAQTTVDSAPS
ncbi:MAG TPA: helix-turn-helix domain-containing protein [Galbitalea sp.]|jgi:DNA-binding transcriptional ArsR family regulator|nr:helix-turn-helix domain-containing protein [Galbitalea sp.]